MSDDFDPKKSYKELEERFNQSDKFAQSLINSLKKSKEADDEIKRIIRKLIKEDTQCKSDIEDISKKIYKEKSLAFQKEFWWKIGTTVLIPTFFIILGAVITKLIK